MATNSNSGVKFGRFLDDSRGEHRVWFFIVPVIIALIALAGVGIYGINTSTSTKREIAAAKGQIADLQKTVDERDKLLATARGDEGVLKSAGQAVAIFYGIDSQAVESGVVVAQPSDKAAKVLLYGLQQPPDGQAYAVAARGADGALHALGDVVPKEDGTSFVLAKEIPEGTTAIELVLRPTSAAASGVGSTGGGEAQRDGVQQASASEQAQGGEGKPAPVSLEGAKPRIAAPFPKEGERGVLTQAPAQAQAQGRSGR